MRRRARCAATGASASGSPTEPFVYVGDGYSDRCPALSAERIFARAGLADYLAAEGVEFEPFETLFDVLHALDG